jgi:hypothetical protein
MARSRRGARKGRIHIKKSRVGSLHKMMGIKRGQKIGHSRLERAAHSGSRKERRKAQFAINMGG